MTGTLNSEIVENNRTIENKGEEKYPWQHI